MNINLRNAHSTFSDIKQKPNPHHLLKKFGAGFSAHHSIKSSTFAV
ncbi:MAG: hypothetical protein JNM36_06490 [Chitinophagales bacterium]|nr:hypothetical protein [Chitinophagales bacterium]